MIQSARRSISVDGDGIRSRMHRTDGVIILLLLLMSSRSSSSSSKDVLFCDPDDNSSKCLDRPGGMHSATFVNSTSSVISAK